MALCCLLLGAPAFGQSRGTVNIVAPSNTPGAAKVLRAEQVSDAVNQALTLKADVTFVGQQTINQSVSTTAYGTGQAVGGLITFTAAARLPSSSGSVQGMTIALPDTQTPTLDVIIFRALPTSTITDHGTVTIVQADLANQVGVLHISDCTGTPTICQSQQTPLPFVLGVNQTTLYAVVVARNAFTLSNLPVGAPTWVVTLYTQQN